VREKNTEHLDPSRVTWESLEAMGRLRIQRWLQDLLEEEVTILLGRGKSERMAVVDGSRAYRNGHGKPRRLAMSCGTITVRRPRVRGLEERFESRLLPLFKRRTEEVGELLPQLYLHGLAQGDFELALRGLLGEGAPLSPSSIERLRSKWIAEYDEWRQRSLEGVEVVYLWADGIYVKAGVGDGKAALLVIVAGLRDGRKVVLSVESGQRESTETWSRILRDLRRRGLNAPRGVVADGHRLFVEDDFEPILEIRDRCGTAGTVDRVRPLNRRLVIADPGWYSLPLVSECETLRDRAHCDYEPEYWEAWIRGDRLQALTEACAAVGARATALGCAVAPVGRFMPAPDYPMQALREGIRDGSVVLHALISATGRVERAEILESNPASQGFEAAALEAVHHWRYSSARLDGESVPMLWVVWVGFGLD